MNRSRTPAIACALAALVPSACGPDDTPEVLVVVRRDEPVAVEVEHHSPTDPSTRPVLVGRILAEDLTPLPRLSIGVGVWVGKGGGCSWFGHVIETDGEARFRFPLAREASPGGYRLVSFGEDVDDEHSSAAIGDHEAVFELTARLPPGEHDLGDVVLTSWGAEQHLGRKDDGALEREYARWLVIGGHNGRYERRVEGCWLEMARRGGPRWIAFLSDELARCRASIEAGPGRRWRHDLELLAALRRAEGARDPLAVEIDGPRRIDATFPSYPTLSGSLRNVDEGGEPFHMASCPSWDTRFRIRAVGPDGAEIPARPAPYYEVTRAFGVGLLRSGEARPFELSTDGRVALPGPGEYRLSVQFHEKADIASAEGIDGRVVFESRPFVLHMAPHLVRLTRARYETQRRWIDALPTADPVPLVVAQRISELALDDPPETPADHLLRAGYDAVPALLEAVGALRDDADLDRGSWVLGMLWNITGMEKPTAAGYRAIGPRRWVTEWPTVEEWALLVAAEPSHGDRAASREQQDPLLERWSALRPWYEVEWID